MYLRGLGILHGSVTPVGRTREGVDPQADARCPQNNILITQDGQACLGDFGIAGAFGDLWYDNLKLGTIRYMAPEQFLGEYILSEPIRSPSKESDVYSLAMTSFAVCPFFHYKPSQCLMRASL